MGKKVLTVQSVSSSLKVVNEITPVESGCINCCMITIDKSDRERFISVPLLLSSSEAPVLGDSGYLRYFKFTFGTLSGFNFPSQIVFSAVRNCGVFTLLSNRFKM